MHIVEKTYLRTPLNYLQLLQYCKLIRNDWVLSWIEAITYTHTIVHFIYRSYAMRPLLYVIADVVTSMIYVHLIPSSEVRKGRGYVT